MSWGFAEGQSVFAADEASYDSVFNVPGVTFVASTGDYGAADPEYPAFSPNVVAVGGTSLTLNADNSYNSETGWGYYSDCRGHVDRLRRRHQPVRARAVLPAGRAVHRLAGPRPTSRWSPIRPPAPGSPTRTTSTRATRSRSWAAPACRRRPGRAWWRWSTRDAPPRARPTLNSSSPTETQQALYSLPQSDYNVITSGSNGYTANAGYNLVTGLGTPIANSLVPDLVAYQGPGTTYSGPTVGPLQDATLSGSWTPGGDTMNVFSVFNALPVGHGGFAARNRGMVTTDIAGHIANSRAQHVSGSADAVPTPEGPQAQPISQAMAGSVATGSDTGAIGIVPTTDAQAARDAVLAGWSSSPKRAAVRSVNVIVPGLASPAPTSALQGNLVDSAIDGFGALPSLLGAGDQADSGPLGRPRRSIA